MPTILIDVVIRIYMNRTQELLSLLTPLSEHLKYGVSHGHNSPTQKISNDYLEWSALVFEHSTVTSAELSLLTEKINQIQIGLEPYEKMLLIDHLVSALRESKQTSFHTLMQLQLNLSDAVDRIKQLERENSVESKLAEKLDQRETVNAFHELYQMFCLNLGLEVRPYSFAPDNESADLDIILAKLYDIAANITHLDIEASEDNDSSVPPPVLVPDVSASDYPNFNISAFIEKLENCISITMKSQLEALLSSLPVSVATNEKELNQSLVDENAKLLTLVESLTSDNNALIERLNSTKDQVTQLEASKSPDEKKLDRLMSKINKLKENESSLKKQVSGFEDRMNTLIKQNADQQQRLQDAQDRLLIAVDGKYKAEAERDKAIAKTQKKAATSRRKKDIPIESGKQLETVISVNESNAYHDEDSQAKDVSSHLGDDSNDYPISGE